MTTITLIDLPANTYFLARVKATGRIHKFKSATVEANELSYKLPDFEIYFDNEITITGRL